MFESLQIRENSVVIYEERIFFKKFANRDRERQSIANARQTVYSGQMTPGAKKRLSRAITLLCQGTKAKWIFSPVTGKYHYHRLSFITLTIASDKVFSGKWAYQNLLKPFLRWMVEVKDASHYIWKLEFQKRGQIHYHITTPAFIDFRDIRAKWNELQRDAGLLDEWMKEHKNYTPPSTEIAETKKVKNMSSYLVKELGKSVNANYLHAIGMVDSLIKAGEIPKEKRKEFINEYTGEVMRTEGKIWGCSETLAGVPYYTTELRWEVQKQLLQYIENKQVYCYKTDYVSMIFFNEDLPPPWHLLNEWEKKNYDDHVSSIFKKPQSEDDITAGVPADLVPTAEPEKEYTWKQLEIYIEAFSN